MFEIKIVFISLKLLEFLAFCISGFLLSRTKRKVSYWKIACIPIIAFTVVEGLRFGRFIDWNLYYFRYIEMGTNPSKADYEPFFVFINYIIYKVGLPYWSFISIQCFLLIFSILKLCENFKPYLKYILPMTLVTVYSNEMFIRWYMGFSFILLSLCAILNKKILQSYIYACLACLCHVGFVIYIPIIVLYKYINVHSLNSKISTILFLVVTFAMGLSDLQFIVSITDMFLSFGLGSLGGGKVGNYLNDTEALVSGDWGTAGVMGRDLSTNIKMAIAYVPAILYGSRVLEQYKYGKLLYNLFVIGAIIGPLFLQIEIFNRIADSFIFFSSIICGVTYYYFLNSKVKNKLLRYLLITLCLACFIYPYLYDIFNRANDNYMLFIWDANGRTYLPYLME